MLGLKKFAEAVRCNIIGRGAFYINNDLRDLESGRSENVSLSSENIGKNPMPRKPQDSSGRFVHVGLVRLR